MSDKLHNVLEMVSSEPSADINRITTEMAGNSAVSEELFRDCALKHADEMEALAARAVESREMEQKFTAYTIYNATAKATLRRNLPQCVIKENLTAYQKDELQRGFHGLNLHFAGGIKTGTHPAASASRKAAAAHIFKQLNYDLYAERNPSRWPKPERHDVLFKEIGGNQAYHIRRAMPGHCCSPILDHKDFIRHNDYRQEIERCRNNLFDQNANIREMYDLVSTNGTKYMCELPSEYCSVTALNLISIHSLYDITIDQISEIFYRSRAHMLIGVFHFAPILFTQTTGKLPFSNMCFRKYRESTGCSVRKRWKIEFSFIGDAGAPYVHDLSTYFSWTQVVRTHRVVNEEDVVIEWEPEDICDLRFLKGIRVHKSLPRQIVVRNFDWDFEKTVSVASWEYSAIPNRFGDHMKMVHRVYPREYWEEVQSGLGHAGTPKFTLETATSLALAYRSRESKNGEFTRPTWANEVTTDMAMNLSLDVYVHMYAKRYELTQCWAVINKDMERLRKVGRCGWLLRQFYAIRHPFKGNDGLPDDAFKAESALRKEVFQDFQGWVKERVEGTANYLCRLKAKYGIEVNRSVSQRFTHKQIVRATIEGPNPYREADLTILDLMTEDEIAETLEAVTVQIQGQNFDNSGMEMQCMTRLRPLPNVADGRCVFHALRAAQVVATNFRDFRDRLLRSRYLGEYEYCDSMAAELENGIISHETLPLIAQEYKLEMCLHIYGDTFRTVRFNYGAPIVHFKYTITQEYQHFELLVPVLDELTPCLGCELHVDAPPVESGDINQIVKAYVDGAKAMFRTCRDDTEFSTKWNLMKKTRYPTYSLDTRDYPSRAAVKTAELIMRGLRVGKIALSLGGPGGEASFLCSLAERVYGITLQGSKNPFKVDKVNFEQIIERNCDFTDTDTVCDLIKAVRALDPIDFIGCDLAHEKDTQENINRINDILLRNQIHFVVSVAGPSTNGYIKAFSISEEQMVDIELLCKTFSTVVCYKLDSSPGCSEEFHIFFTDYCVNESGSEPSVQHVAGNVYQFLVELYSQASQEQLAMINAIKSSVLLPPRDDCSMVLQTPLINPSSLLTIPIGGDEHRLLWRPPQVRTAEERKRHERLKEAKQPDTQIRSDDRGFRGFAIFMMSQNNPTPEVLKWCMDNSPDEVERYFSRLMSDWKIPVTVAQLTSFVAVPDAFDIGKRLWENYDSTSISHKMNKNTRLYRERATMFRASTPGAALNRILRNQTISVDDENASLNRSVFTNDSAGILLSALQKLHPQNGQEEHYYRKFMRICRQITDAQSHEKSKLPPEPALKRDMSSKFFTSQGYVSDPLKGASPVLKVDIDEHHHDIERVDKLNKLKLAITDSTVETTVESFAGEQEQEITYLQSVTEKFTQDDDIKLIDIIPVERRMNENDEDRLCIYPESEYASFVTADSVSEYNSHQRDSISKERFLEEYLEDMENPIRKYNIVSLPTDTGNEMENTSRCHESPDARNKLEHDEVSHPGEKRSNTASNIALQQVFSSSSHDCQSDETRDEYWKNYFNATRNKGNMGGVRRKRVHWGKDLVQVNEYNVNNIIACSQRQSHSYSQVEVLVPEFVEVRDETCSEWIRRATGFSEIGEEVLCDNPLHEVAGSYVWKSNICDRVAKIGKKEGYELGVVMDESTDIYGRFPYATTHRGFFQNIVLRESHQFDEPLRHILREPTRVKSTLKRSSDTKHTDTVASKHSRVDDKSNEENHSHRPEKFSTHEYYQQIAASSLPVIGSAISHLDSYIEYLNCSIITNMAILEKAWHNMKAHTYYRDLFAAQDRALGVVSVEYQKAQNGKMVPRAVYTYRGPNCKPINEYARVYVHDKNGNPKLIDPLVGNYVGLGLVNEYTYYGCTEMEHDALVDLRKDTAAHAAYDNAKKVLIQAVAGAAKTTSLLMNLRHGDVAVAPTIQTKDEITERAIKTAEFLRPTDILNYGAKERDNKVQKHKRYVDKYCKKHFKTITSVLLNQDSVNKDCRLFVDEALMAHSGAIVALIMIVRPTTVYLIGDQAQIEFIPRIDRYNNPLTSISQLLSTKKYMTTTHRCPLKTTVLMNEIYKDLIHQPVTTTNWIEGDLNIVDITNCNQIKGTHKKYITYKQGEKQELQTHLNSSNIHTVVNTNNEYQGCTTTDLAIVRLTPYKNDQIYTERCQAVTAITRSSDSTTYYTKCSVDSSDVLLEMMRKEITRDQMEMVKVKPGDTECPFDEPHVMTFEQYQYRLANKSWKIQSAGDNNILKDTNQETIPRGKIGYLPIMCAEGPEYETVKQGRAERIGTYVNGRPVKASTLYVHIVEETLGSTRIVKDEAYVPATRNGRFNRKLFNNNMIKVYAYFNGGEYDYLRINTGNIPITDFRGVYNKFVKSVARGRRIEFDNNMYHKFRDPNIIDMYYKHADFWRFSVDRDRQYWYLGDQDITFSLDTPFDADVCQSFVTDLYKGRPYPYKKYDHFMLHRTMRDPVGTYSYVPFYAPPRHEQYDCLEPIIRTPMPRQKQQTLTEILASVNVRNLAAPNIAGAVDIENESELLIRAFEDTYLRGRPLSILGPIEYTEEDIEEWMDKATFPSSMLETIGIDKEFVNRYTLSMKKVAKPDLSLSFADKYEAVQTILYHDKPVNAKFSPKFIKLKQRIQHYLPKNVIIFSDKSTEEQEQHLATLCRRAFVLVIGDDFLVWDGVRFLEIDISKYDKSQNELALLFETKFMRRAGFPKWEVAIWEKGHRRTFARDPVTSLKLTLFFQRKSGDASTLLMNTVYLMAIIARVLNLTDVLYHGARVHDFNVDRRISMLYNLEAKLLKYKYAYFASKFVIPIGKNCWRIMPDPAKLIVKLGRTNIVNLNHREETRISLMDLVRPFRDFEACSVLAKAVRERYGIKHDYAMLFHSLAHVADPEVYNSLYLVPENAHLNLNACYSPRF